MMVQQGRPCALSHQLHTTSAPPDAFSSVIPSHSFLIYIGATGAQGRPCCTNIKKQGGRACGRPYGGAPAPIKSVSDTLTPFGPLYQQICDHLQECLQLKRFLQNTETLSTIGSAWYIRAHQ